MLLAAAKVSATLSIIGTVVAEWVGADRGLGRAILLANTNLDTPTVFAGVVTLAMMGMPSTHRGIMGAVAAYTAPYPEEIVK